MLTILFLLFSASMGLDVEDEGRVKIHVQIEDYYNPSRYLGLYRKCFCEGGDDCTKDDAQCLYRLSFMSRGYKNDSEEVKVAYTKAQRLDENSYFRRNQLELTLGSETKPAFLELSIENVGNVIRSNGMIVPVNGHVDKFIIPLTNVLPLIGDQQNDTYKKYRGRLLGSHLLLSVSITCHGDFVGPTCDLICTEPRHNTDEVYCRHPGSVQDLTCKRLPSGQVEKCVEPVWRTYTKVFIDDRSYWEAFKAILLRSVLYLICYMCYGKMRSHRNTSNVSESE